MRFGVAWLCMIGCGTPKSSGGVDSEGWPTPAYTGTGRTSHTSGTGTPGGEVTSTPTGETTSTTSTVYTPPDYELQVTLTNDDAWAMWIDGVQVGSAVGWNFATVQNQTVNLSTDGPHVVAVHGYDVYGVISGFMAEVRLDGVVLGLTGDGSWKSMGTPPAGDWTSPWYDDSAWSAPSVCDANDVATFWSNQPTALTQLGAQWVWTRPCRSLGDSWFRFYFEIP